MASAGTETESKAGEITTSGFGEKDTSHRGGEYGAFYIQGSSNDAYRPNLAQPIFSFFTTHELRIVSTFFISNE